MNKSNFNTDSNIISKKLRKFRRKNQLSQEELAAQPLISKIERNQRFVKDYELVCFCRVLHISERELLSDFYEKYPD